MLAGNRWEVVRLKPGPMPVKAKKTPAPKEGKPVLVPATGLKTVWDLAMLIDPGHAVVMVEQARKVLRSAEQTRRWFHEGMGQSSLRFLLDLFWPDRTELAGEYNPDTDPGRWGYKISPDALEAQFRRLLKALDATSGSVLPRCCTRLRSTRPGIATRSHGPVRTAP